jgi:predicted transcriptional regulator
VHPEEEHRRPAAAVPRYIERFASVLTEAGIPRMPARVFAALMATDSGRLSAVDLADTLQVSAAAVSGAVRYLSQVHLISRQHVRGSRRDYYVVHDDVWQEAVLSRGPLLSRWIDSAREGVQVLGPGTPAGARMARTLAFYQFLEQEMPALLERWRVHRESMPAPEEAAPPAAPAGQPAPVTMAPAAPLARRPGDGLTPVHHQ